ncbi:YodC family protein [Vibrio owensii]|uniref:YodC family protein n=1 Tax=Vibrio owensii TaxID=696485 RepID=UPI003061A4EA
MFNIGDVVRLKSGGPAMTVGEVSHEGSVYCQWFLEGQVLSYSFNSNSLESLED